ncbi:MAG TPA: biopolymer transporter ExbD [Pseudomonadales bacterium]|jgi:biopolymer transport protein ExbD|nr:biopolymer transporter ExbD [Gammaproteobacteria bacterium]MDP6024605.1 biopolymer transporter ExbD [Pseudomonadales bacterium]MDP6315453.1 biopolymer transporter ExbD [Pseudomonadales bacterium]MDP7315090.1 biopolymer transporter ExbD [Pseudomonadales bacterium]HJP51759.1 biopolymer transporter ExbD [Pseudomonadales bacterium]|tara:strand:- start:564 stop:962 length:399 start_codon:yes stop_codon:yes gene_type:complete
MRRRAAKEEEKVADLTPMLDVVFIMLIFFIVTATFIKESGAEIDRPDTKTAEAKKTVSLLVGVSSDSSVWIDKKRVDIRNVRPMMERLHAENPKGGLVIQADSESKVEKVLTIMEAARNLGITQVAIASEEG